MRTCRFLSTFFTFGQLLPTHRHKFSKHGGLFQPTMTEAIRLLSCPPFTLQQSLTSESSTLSTKPDPSVLSPDITDPFSEPHLTYSTNGIDTFPAPSSYPSRRYSWLHIFPEGFVHQHPHRTMRYFKWGVARLILEPEVCPDIIPIWIEGNEQIMHEARAWPRWIPRLGKKVGIWFGDNVGGDHGVFTEMRRRWQDLVEEDRMKRKGERNELGILSEDLKYGKEAVSLRMECAKRMRDEVLRIRRLRGLPDEDPKQGLVETWREEGERREGEMKDGSWVKDV